MAKKRLLIVCYGAGHVNACLPILRCLQAETDIEVHVLGLTAAGKVLADAGVPYVSFKDFVDPTVDAQALRWGEQLHDELANPSIDADESIAYLGLSFADLVEQQGSESAAHAAYQAEGRNAFLPMTVLGRVIDRVQPDVVLATESPRAERAAILQAGARGIPSLVLVGLPAGTHPDWQNAPGFGDRICVFNDFKKQLLISYGRPAEEIVVTGNPLFDRLAKTCAPEDIQAYRQRHGWQDQQVVLWAMGVEPQRHPFTKKVATYPDLNQALFDGCVAWLAERPNVKLVLRPHPTQVIDFGELPDQVELDARDVDSSLLLQSVDAVLTCVSTMGLEALYLNCPLVSVSLSVFEPIMPYGKMGLSLDADRLDVLGQRLDEALAGGWKPESRLPEVGQATRLVVDQINELIA